MTPRLLTPARLAECAAFLERHLGLRFTPARFADLERGLVAASRELGLADVESGVAALLHTPLRRSQIEVLAAHLTIGETYFFREPKTFAALEDRILPELLRARRASGARDLRVWSAGCASGEEAYSCAILLHRLLPDLADWRISILGTDIDPHALCRAAEGSYGEWSLRATPASVKARYFQEQPGRRRYTLVPEIRAMVRFAFLNLAEASYPALLNGTAAIDLLFCRNVLLYFSPEQAARVVERFRHALADGGWLVGGLAEQIRAPGLSAAEFGSGALFQKLTAPAPTDFRPSHPPPARAPLPLALPAPPPVLALPASHEDAAERARSDAVGEARACAGRGELDAALRHCEAALAADKLNPALHFLRATILSEKGDAAEAERALRGALFLDPHFALAHFTLATLLGKAGRHRESARHRELALASLRDHVPDEILPDSGGITAARLAAMIGLAHLKSPS